MILSAIDTTSVTHYVLTNYSSGIILFLIIAGLIVTFIVNFNRLLTFIQNSNIASWFKKTHKHKELTKTDLTNHYFFTQLNFLKNVKLNLLNFGDPVRNYLVCLLIRHKIQYLDCAVKKFIESDFEHLDAKELENRWIQLMYDCMSDYVEVFKTEAHNEEERHVIQVIVDALWQFSDPQIEYGISGIQDVLSSNVYENNIIKIHSLLLPLMVSVEAFIIRCEKALNNLNGKLTGKTFHGQKFPELKQKI